MIQARIRAHSSPWRQSVELYIGDTKNHLRVKEIVMEKADADGFVVAPSLIMSNDQAQTLMDDLWHSGLRPTEGSGSAGSLAATERHLADMRAIAFAKLKLTE